MCGERGESQEGRSHLEVLVELRPPGLLDTVPGPEGLLGLGRPLEDHGVVHIALVRLLDLYRTISAGESRIKIDYCPLQLP